ncbi:MAG: hypothetical protein J3Q66DRAFT_369376 [Benniella sp.]|nr:MAG: hypothetical protein J3Q66DRAFT_369376 [Benniella sp.]
MAGYSMTDEYSQEAQKKDEGILCDWMRVMSLYVRSVLHLHGAPLDNATSNQATTLKGLQTLPILSLSSRPTPRRRVKEAIRNIFTRPPLMMLVRPEMNVIVQTILQVIKESDNGVVGAADGFDTRLRSASLRILGTQKTLFERCNHNADPLLDPLIGEPASTLHSRGKPIWRPSCQRLPAQLDRIFLDTLPSHIVNPEERK